MRHRSQIAALIALAGVAGPVSAQTLNLGYAAGAAQFSGGSADYSATVFSSATTPALLALTSGVTVSGVDLGTLSFTNTGRGPNGVVETIPFSFTRPLTLSVNGAPAVTESEALSGTWGAQTAGSVGQYLVTNFGLDGASAVYDFGAGGTLQASFQSGQAFYDGLGGSKTIPLTANFTYLAPAAVPEASPLALFGLGSMALAGVAFGARRRRFPAA